MTTTSKHNRSELKAVLQLGWPMVLTQLFIMANGFLDTAMAGRYSSTDLAGVSLGGSILWPTFLLLTGLTMALTPIVSQLRGGNQISKVGHQIRQGLWICLATSTLLLVVLLNASPVYAFVGVDASAAKVASEYLAAIAWGVPPLIFYVALRHVSEGLGHPRPPMIIAASVLPLNAVLNYGLIYGEFGLPELGGVGCGWATAIVLWVELLMMMFVMRLPYFRATTFFARFEWPQRKTITSIAKIGGPIGLSIFLEMSLFSVVAILIARIGVDEVAANTIAGNLNWLTFVIPMSIGSAASIRVAFHIGTNSFQQARATAATVYRFSLIYALIISLLLVLFRYTLIGIYTTDPAVVAIAANLLLFIAVYQIVDDSQAVTIGALRGYKDTQVPMYISLVGYWFIALPVGHALAQGILLPGLAPGVYGYWTGLTLGLSIVAVSVGFRLWHISGKYLDPSSPS
ncbi:MAG: MATE family efflux transporter [Gammaproteobacteria bacterium]|nr:MATE family efflux transporter [Gammaproteobacteria bacterium]MCH1549644.1 MATE family efflux transporter [Pseudomonadales bacterium]